MTFFAQPANRLAERGQFIAESFAPIILVFQMSRVTRQRARGHLIPGRDTDRFRELNKLVEDGAVALLRRGAHTASNAGAVEMFIVEFSAGLQGNCRRCNLSDLRPIILNAGEAFEPEHARRLVQPIESDKNAVTLPDHEDLDRDLALLELLNDLQFRHIDQEEPI